MGLAAIGRPSASAANTTQDMLASRRGPGAPGGSCAAPPPKNTDGSGPSQDQYGRPVSSNTVTRYDAAASTGCQVSCGRFPTPDAAVVSVIAATPGISGPDDASAV